MPGLRAEKEITRARMVSYINSTLFFATGEKLSEQETNRLLPPDEEGVDEMAEA